MICVVSANQIFTRKLSEALREHGVVSKSMKPTSRNCIEAMYKSEVIAVVADASQSFMPQAAWLDLLASLGRRIPVVVTGDIKKGGDSQVVHGHGSRYADAVTWVSNPQPRDIVAILDACGAIGVDHRKFDREAVPQYNAQVPLHMLQNNGVLSLLVVNASSFRKIGIEYGSEVLHRVQDCFQQILYDLWGASGSFRAADILCRRSAHSSTYFIFLEPSRSICNIPAPGILEKLADRIMVRLQNSFWSEIFKPATVRMVPDCIDVVPDVSVGFATAIYNPCVDPMEQVDQLVERASEQSRLQLKRLRDRQRELMHSLIQTPQLLIPSYQGVFHLQNVTKEMVVEAQQRKSIRPFEDMIFGFESLIRVRNDAMDSILGENANGFMESRFLRPNVLFSLAQSTKLALELDQTCLQQAIRHSQGLQGTLMINILPRNLYHLDRLSDSLMGRTNLIFEVSESEAINNFDLMMQVRESIEQMNMGVATDDFGKGYAGLEQIIRIRPDLIKLDRSLIQDIHKHKAKQAFVSGLVRAANLSDSAVLGEGVERWEEAEVLRDMGVQLIQGFLMHRPQPVEEILADLEWQDTMDTVA